MNNHCETCRATIPEGQSHCSMCMGDPNYGKDNYYNRWLEEQEQRLVEQALKEREE